MELNTDELVKQAQKGSWDAYLKIFFHRKDALYRKAYYITQNHHDTDDVMEESIIKGFKAVKRMDNPKKVYSYLNKIVINTCYDLIRKDKKIIKIEEDEAIVSTVSNAEASEKIDLHQFLDQLDADYKMVLVLRFFEDMKISEIANILKMPEGTVKSKIYYGLKKLKTLMGGDYREM